MNSEIEKYILDHSDPEGDYLYRLYRATNIHLLHGRMASGHLQGRVLKMLVRMIRPKNILEIGTFSGYSAICLAEGLEEGGMVYTFEINDEQEDFTRPWIEQSAVADKIRFIIGDAMTEAPTLGVEFDMAFVDGDSARIWSRMRWCSRCSDPEDSSLPTTHCGTDMWWTTPTTRTSRHTALRHSMTSWRTTPEWSV